MYNKERIKELHLLFYMKNDNDSCSAQMGLKQCPDGSCFNCSQTHADKHFEIISKERKFACDDSKICEFNKQKFKASCCEECEHKIKEYIEQNFKDIFNGFKTE